MHYFDHRIGKALIDDRLERAEAIRIRRIHQGKRKKATHRLGLLMIALGERLATREAEAA